MNTYTESTTNFSNMPPADDGAFIALALPTAAPASEQTTESKPDLMATLSQLKKADEAKGFALDNVTELVKMDRLDAERFFIVLNQKGVSNEWIRTSLRPAVSIARKEDQPAESVYKTWKDYVRAAHGLGYSFRLNELDDRLEVNGQGMTDATESKLLSKLHEIGYREVEVARRAFMTEASMNSYHPVKDYLRSLAWDGVDRIDKLASCFSDSHEPIMYGDGTTRTVFCAWLYRWLIGAVAKIYNPSIAQTPVIIMDGGQGKGKSFFVKWLCPLPELHMENPIRPDDKDYVGYLCTKWIWEVREMDATVKRADRAALKGFLTIQEGTWRPPYGRHPITKPALASFIGTINIDGELLNDKTGNRRYLPVNITDIDWQYTQIDKDQLWAQVYHLYRNGEPFKLSTEEKAAHEQIVEEYMIEDVMESYIRKLFDIDPCNDLMFTHTGEIIDKLKTFADVRGTDKAIQMDVASTLRTGLKLRKAKVNNQWGYFGLRLKPKYVASEA